MFNDEVTLISYSVEADEIGNQKTKRKEKTLFCEVRSATRIEFYDYGDSELRPEYIVTINTLEYDNEVEAIFRNEPYTITRTYELDRDLLELTLSRRIQR